MFHRLASLLLMSVFLLLLVAGFIFALHNSAPVGIWLGIDLAPRPLSVWLLGFLLFGVVLGLLVSSGLLRAWEITRLRRRLRKQQQEIAGLKQLNAAVSPADAPTPAAITKSP